MASMTTVYEWLRHASGDGPVLGAACEAFEVMLAVVRAKEDPGSVFFASFVMAATLAADGRDAAGFAPSMPRPRSPFETGPADRLRAESAESTAKAVAGLAGLAAARLTQASGQAADPGDRDACEQAARCAAGIHELLARGGP
jgi:hypothetical protein